MRLDSIEISNVRLIGETARKIQLDRDKNILVLLGNNGYGKTTFLDSIATTIAPYTAQFPGVSDFQLSDLDVHVNRMGHRAPYLSVSASYSDGDEVYPSIRYRKGVKNTPDANYKSLRLAAQAKKDAIVSGEDGIELPVFAYYGTGRGQFQVPERKRGFQKTYERWDCYANALSPATDFKRFFGWFDLMEDEERRKKEELRDFDYRSPLLEAVRSALSQFVIDFVQPRIKIHPLRFVMDRVDLDGERHEIRIEQMSDGYKIVIAMVADLAARMAEANPNMENPLDGSGIVLIDEIDLHLHPQWQRTILRQLASVFKNVQFIVTTHSPIIVVGASDLAQVVNLNKLDDENAVDLSTYNVGQVLLSDFFGLISLQSPIWDEKISERDTLLLQQNRSAQDNERLDVLNKELVGVSSLMSLETKETNRLLNEIKDQLSRL